MLLNVHISNTKVLSYHPNGQEKMVTNYIIRQPLEIREIRKTGHGGGCCYEGGRLVRPMA